jgi:hypothetical protein
MEKKICLKCKIEKEYKEFAISRDKKDGMNTYCKSCVKLKRINPTLSFKSEKIQINIPEINNWIKNNYNQLLINSKKICGDGWNKWGLDLLSHSINELLYKPKDYQLKIYQDNKLEHWITYCMNFQLKSSTSPFYYQYRRNLINERSDQINDLKQENDTNMELYENIEQMLNTLDSPLKEVGIELYVNGEELKITSKKLNISTYKIKNKILPELYKIMKIKLKNSEYINY